ncbi:MAG TPA: uracil phosphoribosyltransferase [Polyangiaceae bacterium]|nr:uracil phosphoribosyltransferase [Polyangiaceae bacterium]
MDRKNVFVITHPLISHKLTLMRKKDTSTSTFRAALQELSMLMAYELTRDLPTVETQIDTPLMPMRAPVLEGKKIVLVSVLRAGTGMLDGVLKLIPSARVGHIGLYRDPKTLEPVEYYFKVPSEMADRDVIVMDPMLATGNSAAAAIERVKSTQPRTLKYMCLLAAPEGVRRLSDAHPDVPIYTPAIDERLNDHGYILPGLGDAGDRLYGTK